MNLGLLTRWLIVEAAERKGVDPLRISSKRAWEELQEIMPLMVATSLQHATGVLYPRLLDRIASHRVHFRPGRHDPRPGDTIVKDLGNGHKRQPHKLTH